jgi:hypothetical protein
MYPTLFTIITTVLIAALYAELHGVFDETEEGPELQRVRERARRSGG